MNEPRKLIRQLFFILTILTISTFAAPINNFPVKLIQPDGTVLHCFVSGDEYHNWIHDENNYTIIQNPNTGYYVYAKSEGGEVTASEYIVGRVNPAVLGLEKGINLSADEMYLKRSQSLKQKYSDINRAPSTGTINNLVVFIRFSDESEYTDLISIYNDMLNNNSPGYNSMNNYYDEVSYGTLDVVSTFYPSNYTTTVVSYQDANPRSYYQPYNAVTNPNGYQTEDESGTREHTLLMNAVLAIRSQVSAGLNLDGDSDGRIDNMTFIVQGDPDGWSDLLWPHKWQLHTYNVTINGKRVWTYNFQLQNSLMSSGVGVLCHEMFHSIGAPDLYHYTNNGIAPVGKWDIMENDENPPQHMTAYMKFRYGNWINSIPEITTSGNYNLNPLTNAASNCYKIASPNSATEYFVVEYRRAVGTFESSLPGTGLIVYRINTTVDGEGNRNGPPDEVYIYRPNGTNSINGIIDQANFSSDVGRTSISDITNPSSFLSNGAPGGLNINNVGSSGNTISFDVQIGASADNLTLTSPNGGENWQVGDVKTITWTSSPLLSNRNYQYTKEIPGKTNVEQHGNELNNITNVVNVQIDYSTNNGGVWNSIVGSTANDGNYQWTIPNTPSSNCLVRIIDADNAATFDVSDASFTISAASGTVTNLDDGFETYGDFNLQFQPWTLVDLDGSGTWSIDNVDFTNENSQMAYIIFNPSQTTPALSSTWAAHTGNKYAACFAATSPPNNDWLITPQISLGDNGLLTFWAKSITSQYGLERFKVGVSTSDNNPVNFTVISAGSYVEAPTNWTEYSYDLSSYAGQDIYIAIVCVSNDAFVFMVDDVSVTSQQSNPTITVTSPNGGESWEAESNHSITWNSQDVTNVKIEYSSNGGSTWNTIIASTPSDGTYTWVLPDIESTNCLVRITDTGDPSVTDVSDNVFEIYKEGSITVTSPNGGESWEAQSQHNITWASQNVTYVKIEYSSNSGGTWNTLSNSTIASAGQYNWTLPNIESILCMVRVSDASNSNVSDVSDALFRIYKPGSITVNIPNGGESWEAQSQYNITWSSSNVTNVGIDYSTNNGSTWLNITGSTPASNGSYNWTVPNVSSEECLVKVYDADNPAVEDISDATFHITSAPEESITVLLPNGGEQLEIGTEYSIAWSSTSLSSPVKGVFDTRERGIYKKSEKVYSTKRSEVNPAMIDIVDISLSTDNGGTWNIIVSSAPNTESYPWTVVGPTSNSCLIKITDSSDPEIFDVSNGIFSIIESGGSGLTQFSDDFENHSDFAVEFGDWILLDNDGSTTYGISGADFPNEHSAMAFMTFNPFQTTPALSENWAPHSGSRYVVCFASTNPPNNDWLITPKISVDGQTELKFWARSYTDQYGLEQFIVGITEDLSSFTAISGSTPVEAPVEWTEYIYDLSQFDGRDIYVSIQCISNDAFAFMVDDFSIESTEPTGSITVTYPNGGESFTTGDNINITWESTNVENVDIQYSTNSGTGWNSIVTSLINTGNYNWEIPNVISDDYLIKVISSQNPTIFDASNGTFTVFDVPVATTFEEDFESHEDFSLTIGQMTMWDMDGSLTYGIDGSDFEHEGEAMSFIVFNPSSTNPPLGGSWGANGGDKYAACFAATTPPNVDWLITPKVSVSENYVVRFWAKSITSSYGLERFIVAVSGGELVIDDFEIISGVDYIEAPTEWTEYTFELPAELNACYVGINCLSDDAFVFMIDDIYVGPVTSVDDNEQTLPSQFTLEQNYPNPFNPTTIIKYSIPNVADAFNASRVNVTLKVYNILGSEIRTLVNETQSPGVYEIEFDAGNLSSGIYYYRIAIHSGRLTSGKYSEVRKMILVK